MTAVKTTSCVRKRLSSAMTVSVNSPSNSLAASSTRKGSLTVNLRFFSRLNVLPSTMTLNA